MYIYIGLFFVIALLYIVILDEDGAICISIIAAPLVIISLLIYIFSSYNLESNISRGLHPKTNIEVNVKNNWNDVLVTYNFKNIETETAENIFAAQYEKYGQNLKELNIIQEDKTYQLSLLFQDGNTKQELLSKK